MRRVACGDDQQFVQIQFFLKLPQREQMSQMRRIEAAAEMPILAIISYFFPFRRSMAA